MNYFGIVDCQWGSWNSWNSCSKTCGGGEKTRTRDKTVDEAHGGTCTGQSFETEPCNTNSCPGKCLEIK